MNASNSTDEPRTGKGPRFLTIRTRMMLTSTVAAIASLAIAAVGVVSMMTIKAQTESLDRGISEVIPTFTDIQDEIWKVRLNVVRTRATDAQSEIATSRTSIESQFKSINEAVKAFTDKEQLAGMDGVLSHFQEYESITMEEFFPAVEEGNSTQAEHIRDTKLTPTAGTLFTALHDVDESITRKSAQIANNASTTVVTSVIIMVIIAGVGILVSLGMSMMNSNRIRKNIDQLSVAIQALAKGDMTVTPQIVLGDETGLMASSLVDAQQSMRTILREVVGSATESVKMAEVLAAASAQVAASSAETSAQAAVVATAAEQVSGNVQTVAAGAEQMTASIREIAQNAQEATAVAQTAAATADSTNVTISRLGDSSKEIGDVIKTITSIAEQTNLLALNATIEAARAGEAGKGFAVVASEVKDLAAESARAAEDVARRVEAIQSDTASAVTAIVQISEIIGTINNYQLTIASAVEEQTATTNEMSRSATEAATGSVEIAANINSVATIVEESTSAVAEMDRTIESVSSGALTLEEQVKVFTF